MPPALPRTFPLPLVRAPDNSSLSIPQPRLVSPGFGPRHCLWRDPSLSRTQIRGTEKSKPIANAARASASVVHLCSFCSLHRFDQFSCSSEPRASWRGVLPNTCTLLPHPSLQARPLSHTDSFLQRRTIDYTNTLAPWPHRATVDARLCVVFCGVRRAGKGLSPLEQWPPGARTTAAHFFGERRERLLTENSAGARKFSGKLRVRSHG